MPRTLAAGPVRIAGIIDDNYILYLADIFVLQDDRQAGAQIEVTDQMIAAGAWNVLFWLDDVEPVISESLAEQIAISVFEIMAEATHSKGPNRPRRGNS